MQWVKEIRIRIADNGQIFVAGKGCGKQAEIAGMLHRIAQIYSKKIQAEENKAPKIFMPWEG